MIKEALNGLKTAWKGLSLTLSHFGAATKSKKVKGIKEADILSSRMGL
jgi:NADH-quinone oxidoreductase subunit I